MHHNQEVTHMTAPNELAKIERDLLAREQRLRDELAQTRAALRERQARRDAVERRRQRAIENKQKYLLGAWLLDTVDVETLAGQIDGWLTRDADRELFGLPPRVVTPDDPPEPAPTRAHAGQNPSDDGGQP